MMFIGVVICYFLRQRRKRAESEVIPTAAAVRKASLSERRRSARALHRARAAADLTLTSLALEGRGARREGLEGAAAAALTL